MKSIYNKFVLLKGIIKYLKNPKNVESVLNLGNIVSTDANRKPFIKKISELKDLNSLIKEKYGLDEYDLDFLKKLDKGTLGYEFYSYLQKYNLDANFYKYKQTETPLSDNDYLRFRLRKTHDLWHLVTGFDISEEGEAGLIAFYFAQLRTHLSGLIVCLSFIHFLRKRRQELPLLLNQISRGWNLGNKACPLVEVKWEEYWHVPLKKLQSELNLIDE